MASNHTQHYNLNQWQPTDQVIRTDFNEDNAKLDAALELLNAGLKTANTALGKKLGYSEIIQTYKSSGSVTSGYGFNLPGIRWNDWEYICALVSYPDSANQSLELEFDIETLGSPHKVIKPLSMPGYLAVLLPRHNGTQQASGFVLSSRFIPFTLSFSYQDIHQFSFNIKTGTAPNPNVTLFGGK